MLRATEQVLKPMIQIRRILCPIDFSDFSRRAVEHAITLAKWYESTITLVHVCTVVPVTAYAPGSNVYLAAARAPVDRDALLGSMKQFAESEAGATVPIEFAIAEGAAATEILAEA